MSAADISALTRARVLERLREDEGTQWVLVRPESGGGVAHAPRAVITAIGDTPLEDVRDRLARAAEGGGMTFVLLKCHGVMEGDQLAGNKRAKFVFVCAAPGSSMKLSAKAAAAPVKAALAGYFKGYHAHLDIFAADEVRAVRRREGGEGWRDECARTRTALITRSRSARHNLPRS